jgi:hypothetical protein
LLDRRRAQVERLKVVNEFLVDLLVRTRTQAPGHLVIDLDATDDPVHGRQPLSGYQGYYRQHQYLPLLVFEGTSGFPLACWLRPGTIHGACGVVEVLRRLVERLRLAWPGVEIRVRADNGLAVPAMFDYCEEAKLGYALGYASNAVLARASEPWLDEVQLVHRFYGHRDPHVQRYEQIADHQANTWPQPRRVVVTPQGSRRRYVVTNLPQPPEQLYQDFYVQRGDVPEGPIGEVKDGLSAGRLSTGGFCADTFEMLVAVAAYALVVLYRQECAAAEGVGSADVQTLRRGAGESAGGVGASPELGGESPGGAASRPAVASGGRTSWTGAGVVRETETQNAAASNRRAGPPCAPRGDPEPSTRTRNRRAIGDAIGNLNGCRCAIQARNPPPPPV